MLHCFVYGAADNDGARVNCYFTRKIMSQESCKGFGSRGHGSKHGGSIGSSTRKEMIEAAKQGCVPLKIS